MKRLKVIGIGSRIMGDDGIGVYVVEELIRQQFFKHAEYVDGETDINCENSVGQTDINFEYVIGETDIDYCFDYLESDNESFVIIIDAAMSGKNPGTVTEFTITDMDLCTSMTFSAHNNSIIEAIAVFTNFTNFRIIGIEPELVDFKWGLSDALSEAFPHIIDNVKKSLLQYSN